MEGLVEGQRREGEKGQKKGRGRREGINGGGGGGAKKRRGKNKEEKGGRALMEGEEGQRRGGSIEGQASARGRGRM